jgi:cytosine/adenosine deaminase-related metal-dependent hydrolase
LRVFSFLEMIGITGRRPPEEILGETLSRARSLRRAGCRPGLSPHAPYSTLPSLLAQCGRAMRRHRLRLATHVAESATEYEMFRHGRGEMYEWLKRSAREMSDCGGRTPVEHLERCGVLGPSTVVAHANYITPEDIALLAERGVSVAHCPRSHAYFRHDSFPFRPLMSAGVNICLGTDSLASVWKSRGQVVELDMFQEMGALAVSAPFLAPRAILRMATVNGAISLGIQDSVGHLTPGTRADLVSIPFSARPKEVYEAVVAHCGPVKGSMVSGRWVIPPPRS